MAYKFNKGPIKWYEIPIFVLFFSPVFVATNYENDILTIGVFLLCTLLSVAYMLWFRRKIFPSIGLEMDKKEQEAREALAEVDKHKWIGYIIIGVAIFFGILLYTGKYDLIFKLSSYLKIFGL
jgi:hypothetical protein